MMITDIEYTVLVRGKFYTVTFDLSDYTSAGYYYLASNGTDVITGRASDYNGDAVAEILGKASKFGLTPYKVYHD